ncbi:hypothetical protein BGZ83_011982 [Gryganskiella cystojenkinii]|nr:hypothetical protein BGZ83_011982 [Gryganskiella cystojenkinii]
MTRRNHYHKRSTRIPTPTPPCSKEQQSSLYKTPRNPRPLHILITGAGIGGLSMGLMLERANIAYTIIEASRTIRPVGSALSIGPNVMRVLEQLGFLDEILRESKPVRQIRYYDRMHGDLNPTNHDGIASMMFCEMRYGNAIRLIPRTMLHNMLLSRVPKHKVLMGKRVVSTTQVNSSYYGKENGESGGYMTCTCQDGSVYEGTILVGADGSYSMVRKHMLRALETKGESIKDETNLKPYQHCVVGITDPLDPIEFESLNGNYSEFQILRGRDNQRSIWLMPLNGYRIAWNLFCQFPEDLLTDYNEHRALSESSKNLEGDFPAPCTSIASSDPSSRREISNKIHEHAKSVLKSLAHVKNPLSNAGGDFGDLVEKTQPDHISFAMMEQGIFKRWYHGRTVLIGDACHKSLPYGGQGANQAILDSVFLVNRIFALSKNPTTRDFESIFEDYQKERTTSAYLAVIGSSCYDCLFGGQGYDRY